jgi:hypothetical protein
VALVVGLFALALGSAAAWNYAGQDLTLSHYDARGHLMVARRVFDNLTPGWMQLGAVWLPLPHLLNAVPVQWDLHWHTGLSAVLISISALTVGLAALASWVARHTGSWVAAGAVPLAVLVNPNVLYLQSTPMTEPLLFGLSLLSLWAVDQWVRDEHASSWPAGLALSALVLTRYEGWCIGGVLWALAAVAHPHRSIRLAAGPALAILSFLGLSYGSTGQWFTTGGFFEATNPALGDPGLAWEQITAAAGRLSTPGVLTLGTLGAGASLWAAWQSRTGGRAAVISPLLPLSLFAAALLPLYAFTSGHPVRVRYMIAFVVAHLVSSAHLFRWGPRALRSAAAVVWFGWLVWMVPPLNPEAPMVREAQWERPYSAARQTVTSTLKARWDGTPVLASMGSLGHYMQQMGAAGFALKDFVHEGNGRLWQAAEVAPAPYVRWILIEESAEGGDILAQRVRGNPGWLDGFTRIVEAGGVALYERRPDWPLRSGSEIPR